MKILSALLLCTSLFMGDMLADATCKTCNLKNRRSGSGARKKGGGGTNAHPANVISLSDISGGNSGAAFDGFISQNKFVVVDFYSPDCGPCKRLITDFPYIASQLPNVTFLKVDVTQNHDLASRYGVRGVPHIVLFNGGNQVHKTSGYSGSDGFMSMIRSKFGM